MAMASVFSEFIDNHLVRPRGQPVARCVKDIFHIRNASCCFRPFYPQNGPESRKLRLRSHQLYGKLPDVPLLAVYGMVRNQGSTSKKVSQVVESSHDSKHPLPESIAGQINALDSYFTKLNGDISELSDFPLLKSDSLSAEDREVHQTYTAGLESDATKLLKSELGSLNNYLDKLSTCDGTSESENDQKPVGTSSKERHEFIKEGNGDKGQKFLQSLNDFASKNSFRDEISPMPFENATYEEVGMDDSYFPLINLFSAINIGVYLFEIASPVRDANFEQLSLPLLYGAKVNQLILDGEWWRLVTPMFLHSGFLHVALSCWVLLSFGPKVCRAYGPFTFFLMYILGGICSNLICFIYTPDPTVSGMGPIFAIIGAWLIYQFQNKEEITKEVSDNMFRKAVIATALSFFLADSSQIDEWTHIAAAVSGVLYGFYTCPTMQLNDPAARNDQKEGAVAARQQADPLKSTLIFIIFIMAMCPLVYMSIPDSDIPKIDSFF